MARFEIPRGWVAQAYRFALDPTPRQTEDLLSHAGGARFAYNVMLAAVKANLDQRAAERSHGIAAADLTPLLCWSFQALRNEWNRRKHTVAVGAYGLPWWPQNSKEVYANACRSLSEALSNWQACRNDVRPGPRMGFPRFKTKSRAPQKFSFSTGAIRVESDSCHITLPRLGAIKSYESTRKLARRVAVARQPAPRELKAAQRKLQALQRKAARQIGPWDYMAKSQRDPSRGWQHTQHEIARTHARVAYLRADRVHKLTTGLSQTHTVIGCETLAVKNTMTAAGSRKRGLNRALGDAGFGDLFHQLDYKSAWYGSQIIHADRWFASSKLCSGCGAVKAKLHLAERAYQCDSCALVIDRDLNAAVKGEAA